MKKILSMMLFVALMMFTSTVMATTFDFTYDSAVGYPSLDITGVLNANPNGDGSFTAISGSGEANSIAINLVFNPAGTGASTSPAGNFIYDNQLFPANPAGAVLDGYGLVFTASTSPVGTGFSPTEMNIWGNGAATLYTYYENYLSDAFTESGTFTLAVPEPLSLLLLGLGLIGVAGVRRKFKG